MHGLHARQGFNCRESLYKHPVRLITRPLPQFSPKQRRARILCTRRQVLEELKWHCAERRQTLEQNNLFKTTTPVCHIASIKNTIQCLASKQELGNLESKIKDEFNDIFKPIPHIDRLPAHEPAHIHLKDPYKKISNRSYPCPQQYKEAFATLIQQRLDSGFIRPSSSSFASPSFITPKKDPKALPRWVCDYQQLNANTIPDNYPLPRISEILADCGKGKIWSTIDMTDSFFQTRIHPDDIHKTAVTTRAANRRRLGRDTGAVCRGRMPTRLRLEFDDTRPGFDGPPTICTMH
jgi:hypothetical protein